MSKKPPRPDFALPELDEAQLQTRARMEALEEQLNLLEREKYEIIHNCNHVWLPYIGPRSKSPYEWCTWRKDWEICSHASCAVCGDDAGKWYCVASPTKLCEYDNENDPAWDHCLHCGDPDERK